MAKTTVESQRKGAVFRIRRVYRLIMKHRTMSLTVIGVISFLLMNFGSSFKASQMVIPPKPPERFFSIGSAVLDFPYGNIEPITDLIVKEEIIFLMYYAPWCSKSRQIRVEFAKAAKYFQNRVRFVAVNCWWPHGECKTSYKLLGYPEIFLYHTNLDGFKFTGIPTADYMIRFVEDIIYPLKILHTREQVKAFNSKYDNTIIGFFDFHASPQPPGYRQLYYTAMRLFEEDFYQPVRVAIVTQTELANLLGLYTTKSFVLHRLTNTSLIYPTTNNFTDHYMINWIMFHRQKPLVHWLSPPGHKTLHLSSAVNKGPAVIVYIPVNQLHTDSYYYNMVREISLHYMNCNNGRFLQDAVELSIRHRLVSLEEHRRHTHRCQREHLSTTIPDMMAANDKNCCVSLVTSHVKEYSKEDSRTVCEYCKHIKTTPFLDEKAQLCMLDTPTSLSVGEMFRGITLSPPQCLNTVHHYNANEYRTLCCKECSYNVLSKDKCSSRKTTDPFIANGHYNFQNKICNNLKMQQDQNLSSPLDFVRDFSRFGVEVLAGLQCQSNRTVNLHVMDVKHHSIFLERLVPGYPVDVNTPAVVLVDKMNEAQFVLRETFNKQNLAQFMLNYTRSDLDRFLRSGSRPAPCYGQQVGVCIREITSLTFHDVVLQQDKDVVLLLYTPWCGFCAGFAHLYLNLAKYFKTAQNLIFARIDADTNDLPWEFTVSTYPTILFFPAHRKSDSMVFLDSIPKTLPNLIKFVLHHSTHDLRLDTAADVCSKSCIDHNRVVMAATIDTLKRRSRQYTGRLRSLMSQLSSLIHAMSPTDQVDQPSKDIGDDPFIEHNDGSSSHQTESRHMLQRRLAIHMSIKYVQKKIRKMEKRIKEATHLHNYLLNHKNSILGKEELFKYISEQVKDKKFKTKS